MRILITGASGLVGSALKKVKTDHEMIFVGRRSADLTEKEQVRRLFSDYRPSAVINCAAFVGGVGLNATSPWDLFYQNITMNANVIKFAVEYKVKKLLAFSSVCAMPDGLPVLKEEFLHTGEPPIQSRAYGFAKRMIDVMLEACKGQFGMENWCSIISTNIFGINDDYRLASCHVIPALIHKLFLAKRDGTPFKIWGTGSAKREVLDSDDLAEILFRIIDLPSIPVRIIVSNNRQYTIREIVERLCRIANFDGRVIWETEKPNGQHARPSDTTLLRNLIGQYEYIDIDESLAKAYNWFAGNYPNIPRI